MTDNQPITLNITSIQTSGDFIQSNNCGQTLPALGSCTINVTFNPTAKGRRPGVLTVSDDATNSPQTASLTGIGSK